MLAILETDYKTVMGNSGGKMGHFIEETTITASDRVTANFITQ
jgi:hypothetical protein